MMLLFLPTAPAQNWRFIGGRLFQCYHAYLPASGEYIYTNFYQPRRKPRLIYPPSYFRAGVYAPPTFPYILGKEGAGTIAALGTNTPPDLKVGDRVAYMADSAYAEYTPAASSSTIPLPSSISTQTAAASLLQALTAVTLIREAHAVQKGDWILVTAAAGGVGLWLCQLLKAVGARTIATASSAEKRELAKKNGAEVTLEYHEGNRDAFVEEVLKITGGEGVHAVFDSVGKDTFDSSLKVVRRKGSMVSFGNASGPVTGFALRYVFQPSASFLALAYILTVNYYVIVASQPRT
jgi:NADPH2:quinone reductase